MNRPYMQFYFRDHQSDLGLKQCHPISRFIWFEMLCWMAQGEPYGHLRELPPPVAPPAATPRARPRGGASGGASGIPPGTPPGLAHGVPPGLELSQISPGPDGSLEPCLPTLVGMSSALVEWSIKDLESHRVFSRTPTGVIYSRRMVRDAEKHTERVRKATEAYNRRQRKTPGAGQRPPAAASGRARGAANGGASGGANGTPPGTPPGTARGAANGGASGGAYIQNQNQSIKSTPPNPPSTGGRRPSRADREAQQDAVLLDKLEKARR